MRKTILACDECHKEKDIGQAIDWLSVAPPDGTRVTLSGCQRPDYRTPYGLFCSVGCLMKHLEKLQTEPSLEDIEPIRAAGTVVNMTVDEVAKWRGDAWKELE
jgi:hypothetical protein